MHFGGRERKEPGLVRRSEDDHDLPGIRKGGNRRRKQSTPSLLIVSPKRKSSFIEFLAATGEEIIKEKKGKRKDYTLVQGETVRLRICLPSIGERNRGHRKGKERSPDVEDPPTGGRVM